MPVQLLVGFIPGQSGHDIYNIMKVSTQKKILATLLFLQFCLVAGFLYYEKNYWSKDFLVIAYLQSDRVKASLSPYGHGFEKELASMFCRRHGLKPHWVSVESISEGIAMLQSGQANILIGGPHSAHESWDNTFRGPEYMSGKLLIVHNQWRYPIKSINDLCTTQVVVPGRLVFSHKVSKLQDDLGCMVEQKHVLDAGEYFFDLLSNRKFRFGLVDELSYNLWHGFFPQVHKTHAFDTEYGYAWIWSSRYKDMDRLLTAFWDNMVEDTYLAGLKDRYFGFFPYEKDSYQLRHFVRAIENRLPLYAETIIEASRKYNIDPLLLTALIYQESHFDPNAHSRTGVRGLVQMTADTAEFMGVENRLDPAQSIMGAAAYLDYLKSRVEERGVSSWNKWFFTLAAYNQGLGHLLDAMELAQRKGKDNLCWYQLKQVYPLLSYTRYFETLPRGYARGFEAVNFVENIRYYYYILYSLISLSRPEVEHLGGFIDSVPGNWPD